MLAGLALAFLTPALAAGTQEPPGKRRLHPEDSAVYLEVPDVRELMDAYPRAPMARFVRDPQGRESLAAMLAAFDLDFGQLGRRAAELLGLSEQEADAWNQAPERLSALSISVSFPDSDGAASVLRSAEMLVIFELDSQESAEALARWVAGTAERLEFEPRQGNGATPEPASGIGAIEGHLQVFRGRSDPADSIWTLAWGQRLALGWGPVRADALVERVSHSNKPAPESAPESALADKALSESEYERLRAGLSPPQGTTVAQGFCNLGSTLDLLGPDWAEALRSLRSARAWRMQLRGDRFVSESHAAADANSASFFGKGPISENLWAFAPADAVVLAAATLDEHAAIRQWALDRASTADPEGGEALRDLEARYDFDLRRDVLENLGPGALLYVLPILGLPPSGAAVVEVRDPAAFERALKGLLAQFEDQEDREDKLGGAFTLRYRPYRPPDSDREVPMWIASLGGMSPVSPTLAILERHALVTTTSLRAKREVRRLLADEGAQHPLVGGGALPENVRLASYVDWGALLDGAYTSARGLLSLASLGGAAKLDLKALPADAGALTQFLAPTIFWSRCTPDGSTSRLESSFGPETWIGLALLGAVTVAVPAHDGEPIELESADERPRDD